MDKFLKFSLLILWIALFAGFIAVQFYTTFQPIVFESISYYWVLILWIFLIWQFKLQMKITLFIACILILLSGLILILGFFDIGEKLARLAFIGWILGFCQALLAYQKASKV